MTKVINLPPTKPSVHDELLAYSVEVRRVAAEYRKEVEQLLRSKGMQYSPENGLTAQKTAKIIAFTPSFTLSTGTL